MVYDNANGGEYGKYFVQNSFGPAMDGEFKQLYDQFAHRILWMDGNVVPGAFQMNTAWYCGVPERDPIFTEHSHPYSELIGFYGSDPADPYNLNGEIIFSINGEAHRLTRSSLIFLPPNAKHNPMRILRVDKPIFHFSVVMNDVYGYEGNGSFRAE